MGVAGGLILIFGHRILVSPPSVAHGLITALGGALARKRRSCDQRAVFTAFSKLAFESCRNVLWLYFFQILTKDCLNLVTCILRSAGLVVTGETRKQTVQILKTKRFESEHLEDLRRSGRMGYIALKILRKGRQNKVRHTACRFLKRCIIYIG
jgi:hypothetical protein